MFRPTYARKVIIYGKRIGHGLEMMKLHSDSDSNAKVVYINLNCSAKVRWDKVDFE